MSAFKSDKKSSSFMAVLCVVLFLASSVCEVAVSIREEQKGVCIGECSPDRDCDLDCIHSGFALGGQCYRRPDPRSAADCCCTI